MGSIEDAFSEYLQVSACMGSMMYALLREVSASNRMLEVARNRTAFHKSKLGNLQLVNALVSTPGNGFTGIYIHIYIYIDIHIYIYIYIYIWEGLGGWGRPDSISRRAVWVAQGPCIHTYIHIFIYGVVYRDIYMYSFHTSVHRYVLST